MSTFDQLIRDTEADVRRVEAMPDDAPHRQEVLEVFRDMVADFKSVADDEPADDGEEGRP